MKVLFLHTLDSAGSSGLLLNKYADLDIHTWKNNTGEDVTT